MNGNTFVATVNALNMHYLGAESDIINRSLRTCQCINIIALAKVVYVFSAVREQNAAKWVFMKFVEEFGLNSPGAWLCILLQLKLRELQTNMEG